MFSEAEEGNPDQTTDTTTTTGTTLPAGTDSIASTYQDKTETSSNTYTTDWSEYIVELDLGTDNYNLCELNSL